ncbi:MAG: response regulator [Candidatus Omnitrophota bacterium]
MIKKILIVEDNEVDRKLMLRALISAGYANDIYVADSGEKGVERFKDNKPDVVVLDTVLPGMDGFETCKRIKDIDQNANIIILTGEMGALNREKAKEAGANEYIAKGLNYAALKDVFCKINQ